MIELKTLPLKIGNYTRDNTNSRSFLNKEIAKGYTISDDLKTLIFGTWRPEDAVLKRFLLIQMMMLYNV